MAKIFRTVESARQELAEKFPHNDYSKFVFTSTRAGGIVTCKKHGEFFSKNFVKLIDSRYGCTSCNLETRNKKPKLADDKVIKNLSDKHPEVYFSEVIYTGVGEDITFPCAKHGFQTRPYGLVLIGKYACLKCGAEAIGRDSASAIDMNRDTDTTREELSRRFSKLDFTKSVYTSSADKIKFVCPEHGEVENTLTQIRNSEYGCPRCGYENRKTNLRSLEEAIREASLAHPDIDFSSMEYKGNSGKIEFVCPTHGVQSRNFLGVITGKNACRKCSNEDIGKIRLISNEDFIKRGKELYGDLVDSFEKTIYTGMSNKITLICSNEKHGEYEVYPSNYLYNGGRCHRCTNPKGRSSQPEREMAEFIENLGFSPKLNFRMANRREIDLYFPDLNFAIEFDGIFSHGDKCPDRNSNQMSLLEKTNYCKSIGITLLHIYEDEWKFKKEIVKNRLTSILGKSETTYARKCVVKEISGEQAGSFLEKYHIQGDCRSSTKIGLFQENILVAVMTFARKRFYQKQEANEYELVRYCSRGTLVGGFSKLLKFFVRLVTPSKIISYSDKRWSIGNVYNKNGFTLHHTSKPGYYWCRNGRRTSRFGMRKQELKNKFPETYSDEKTEDQICRENGYWKVHDCGQDCWIINF